MLLKIHSTLNNRYFIRTIRFDESEVEYSDANFSEATQIDIKNQSVHLEMTRDIFEITIEETVNRGGDRTVMQVEDVLLVIWEGTKYFSGDLKKFASDLSSHDRMMV